MNRLLRFGTQLRRYNQYLLCESWCCLLLGLACGIDRFLCFFCKCNFKQSAIRCRQAVKMAGKQAVKKVENMEKRGGSVPSPARAPGISQVFV